MNVLIYGNEPPRISFTYTPEGGITFKIENEKQIELDSEKDAITWYDLYQRPLFVVNSGDFGLPSEKEKSIYRGKKGSDTFLCLIGST